jgi:sporulation protein YabP
MISMQEQEKQLPTLELINRQLLRLNSVQNVAEFDEEVIVLETELGRLEIKGAHLNVTSLDVEDGNLQVDGIISSFRYLDERQKRVKKKKMGGLMARMFS